eukprot:s5898_g1.t1
MNLGREPTVMGADGNANTTKVWAHQQAQRPKSILQISENMSFSSRIQEAVMMISSIWPSPPRGIASFLMIRVHHFDELRSDDRKVWISSVEEGTFVDHSQPTLSYSDFIEKDLLHRESAQTLMLIRTRQELSLFAKYDVERAVPSLVDGLKPGQRKVLYGSFKKKLTNEIKVAQLSGYVAETSAYHHGEASLQGTIIAMAQTFVGSNNINLFEPRGQFGSRLQGGKDHAAARYIFTCLCKARNGESRPVFIFSIDMACNTYASHCFCRFST